MEAIGMSCIRTILGDIAPDALGLCYAHEHIIIDHSHTTEQSPDFLLDDVDPIAGELSQAKHDGVGTMVDSMPMSCGRNVLKLAQVSRRSGIHILCPTGLHLRKYYPDWHWCSRIAIEQLAQLFIDEIALGIDANDGNGPVLERSPHRAGLIKIASGLSRIDDHERRVFEAAAIAHRATGAPILTHTEQGTAGLDQIDLLRKLGVDLSHVVLSHTDRQPDEAYHRDILTTGVRVEYDSAFRWKTEINPTLDLIVQLSDDYPDQIMLGMDAARRSYWRCFGGGPGMSFLATTFSQQLRDAGVSEEQLRSIFVTTPASAYAMSRVAEGVCA
jgi:5-phospho-D-xylono-1,4-lactonase